MKVCEGGGCEDIRGRSMYMCICGPNGLQLSSYAV